MDYNQLQVTNSEKNSTVGDDSFSESYPKGLGGTIRKLMQSKKLKEADLARQVNLPQTTVNRLLTHESPDPRLSTILPIAQFLGLSLGQLVGLEPILENYYNSADNQNLINFNNNTLPIIGWNDILPWLKNDSPTPENCLGWVASEHKLGPKSFVLESMYFMESRFKMGSKIIINTKISLKDASYVLVLLDGQIPTIKRIMNEGGQTYLKSFEYDAAKIELINKYQILGSVVEVRENIL